MNTPGSFLVVLTDGHNYSGAGSFSSIEGFRQFVRRSLEGNQYRIDKFYYAWGGESQQYNGAEVRETYFR